MLVIGLRVVVIRLIISNQPHTIDSANLKVLAQLLPELYLANSPITITILSINLYLAGLILALITIINKSDFCFAVVIFC